MDWNEFFFRHVYLAAAKSKDPRTQIGAILVRDRVVISEGFNGFPRKVLDSKERLENRETKLDFIVHGEANAILNACRHGVCTSNSILITNGTPCNFCAKLLIQAGVKSVLIHEEWENLFLENKNWQKSVEISKIMLKESEIPVNLYSKFFDINVRLDGKIIKI